MSIDERIRRRFEELEKQADALYEDEPPNTKRVDLRKWARWSTNALHLLRSACGPDSVHFIKMEERLSRGGVSDQTVEIVAGILNAARSDYEGGYLLDLRAALSGEILGDFLSLSRRALAEGYKDVAAVLASAALEDALKRYARVNSLNVDDRVMQEVVAALRTRGLVGGAQKALLEVMPKLRDFAMHANWSKFTEADVNSMIAFVEQFLLQHFGSAA
jgi:hypothetical protein